MDEPLPFGELNARALPYETYTLALTDTLLTTVFGPKLTADVLAVIESAAASGYLSGPALVKRLGSDTTGKYWRCSGITGFRPDAPQHFYHPERYTDPFGNVTMLEYDNKDLYVRSSTDPLENRTEVAEFDFRVLAPSRLKDINGNYAEVRFDVLGMPTAIALSGKDGEGETLDEFDGDALDPALDRLIEFFVIDDYDSTAAKELLHGATGRFLYYFGETTRTNGAVIWGQHPPCSASILREQHKTQLINSPVQAAFAYSDGAANVVVEKIQAEPATPDSPLRWVANGKTIVNNKGKRVKQYEPYFSPPEVGHRFEEPREIGVTPVLFYDAVGRPIRTEAPDGTISRIEFTPWQVVSYDPNDTVLEPGNGWYARMSASAVATERRAAQLAAEHADTPTLTLLDTRARAVLSIAHNRVGHGDEKYVTFTRLDTEDKPLWVQDARGNRVMQFVTPPLPAGTHPFDDAENLALRDVTPCYDLAGQPLFQHSADAGDRWTLYDATGIPLYTWNSRGMRSRATYDALHRLVGIFMSAAGATTLAGAPRAAGSAPDPEVLVQCRVYGEAHPDARANLRGRPYQLYDGAGVLTTGHYDFKGNLVSTERRLARDYKDAPD